MTTLKKVAAIQMTSVDKIDTNLKTAAALVKQAANAGACMAVLPEMFPTLSVENGHIQAREPLGDGPIQHFLQQTAKENDIWIVGGTIPIATEDDTRVRASCIVYNNQGEQVTHYNKIHLCDVRLENGTENYHESAKTIPGNTPVVFESPIGIVGLAVCYDLRFAELFKILRDKGAEVFILPSAFLTRTGAAHWEVLCRARAIENQAYFIAANQTGTHPQGRKSYGHSMIIDPWGKVLNCLNEGAGIVIDEIDINFLQDVRSNVPIHAHRRL
jgi:nitrilase